MKYTALILASLIGLALSTSCPDGGQCSGNKTCCQLASGRYGCCPFPNAVCCSDKRHCCPHATTCDVAHGRCKQGGKFASETFMAMLQE